MKPNSTCCIDDRGPRHKKRFQNAAGTTSEILRHEINRHS